MRSCSSPGPWPMILSSRRYPRSPTGGGSGLVPLPFPAVVEAAPRPTAGIPRSSRVTNAPIVVLGTGFAGFGAGHRWKSGRPPVRRRRPQRDLAAATPRATSRPAGSFSNDGPHVSFTKRRADPAGSSRRPSRATTTSVPIGLDNYWRGQDLYTPGPGEPPRAADRPDRPYPGRLRRGRAREPADEPPADYETWCGARTATRSPRRSRYVRRKYHTTGGQPHHRLGGPPDVPAVAGRGAPGRAGAGPVRETTTSRISATRPTAAMRRTCVLGRRRTSASGTRSSGSIRARGPSDSRTAGRPHYDRLVSSMPLPELFRCRRGAGARGSRRPARLAYTSVVLVNLGVERPDIGGEPYQLFLRRGHPFSRLSFPHKLSPHTVPAGARAIQAEWYCRRSTSRSTSRPTSIADRRRPSRDRRPAR